MLDSDIFTADLGTLSYLPREIRDRIYSYTLNFNFNPDIDERPSRSSPSTSPSTSIPRTSLIMTSKRIHAEAKICLFQTNEFCIWVDHDYIDNTHNRSVMGHIGYTMHIGHNDNYHSRGQEAFFKKTPWDMLPHMQLIHLSVGCQGGLREMDIEPPAHRCISGPERTTYVPLLKAVEDVCTLLKSCHQLHKLRVSVRSIEETPGSIEKVMVPIRNLRRIKHSNTTVWSMQDDCWVDWNLKGSYGRYMDKIMALPEGVEAPRYVGDEKEPNQSDDNIFDIIGARWMGGRTFEYPEDDDDGSWSDEEDEFEEFMEHMFHHSGMTHLDHGRMS